VNFSQFLDAAHISTLNCDEVAEDRPTQTAYEIFRIKLKFQQFDPLDSRRPAQASVKDGYPPKSGYFTAIGS